MLYDKDIREPLFDFLEEYFGKIRIIEEKQMGKSRADIVMVTETSLVGVEIKSDADTYVRLAGQVKDYNIFFDSNMIVAGSTHAAHIKEHVPDWWGIITVEELEDRVDFYIYREMRPNPAPDIKRQMTLLWRPELAHIQELNGMAKYKEKSKQFVIEKIAEKIPLEVLKRQISGELFERDYNLIAETIIAFKEKRKRPVRAKRRRRRL